MSGVHTIDLRIYDLCKNKLQLSEGDSAAVALELQEIFETELKEIRLEEAANCKVQLRELEDFVAQRVEFLRRDIHNMHVEFGAELRHPPDNPALQTELMQWMFTYFVFQMGGIIALILLLLRQ